jgi:hypothetical protein
VTFKKNNYAYQEYMPLIKDAAKLAVGVECFATLLKGVRYETLAEFVNVSQMDRIAIFFRFVSPCIIAQFK